MGAWRWRATRAALTVPVQLRLESLEAVAARARDGVRDSPPPPAEAMARWVDRLLRRLPRPWRLTCLNRTAVLYLILRHEGVPVEWCIGVARADGRFSAHAWLELEGAPYLEFPHARVGNLQVIARFPETRRHAGLAG